MGLTVDKRNYPRVRFEARAHLKQGHVFLEGDVKNLCLKGMFFLTDRHLDPTKLVEVTIFIGCTEKEMAINIQGRIGRIEEKGFALEFMEMELDSYIMLKNVLFYADHELHEFYEFM